MAEALDHRVDMLGSVGADHTVKADEDRRNSVIDEKKITTYVGEWEETDSHEEASFDPFVPFDDLPDEKERVVTVRAVVLGMACGALVNASNIYLGLKTGWTFTANLFGALVGFAVLKSLSTALPENFPILGGSFGPRENNIVQTSATAAGGLSNVFVSAIPALYQLGLLNTPKEDFWRLVPLTIVGGYFGFAFATPLRKFFIVYVARELRLVFPTPSATSFSIRAMHSLGSGEAIAKMKVRALGIAFSSALILRVVSQYAIGILWDWHIFTWFFIWGNYHNAAMAPENWGWFIEWTPAFIGSGMLVGLNASISFFAGSVIAWGIIGPALVHNGAAFGRALYTVDDGYSPEFVARWGGVTSFYSLGKAASTADTPSPRFWLIWPGVLCMIVVSFVELILQYKVFVFASRAIWRACCKQLSHFSKSEYLARTGNAQADDDLVKDPALPHQQVPWYWWFPLLILTIILSCVVMGVQFGLPVGETLLSIFLAFFFSFLAVQCTGVSDITPLTAASKASQIILGGATKGENWPILKAQRLNLLGGALANVGADQSSSLVSDFRVGFLLRTPPNQQWIAQGISTIVACFIAPALFMLFTIAYPCVLDLEAETCTFSGPSAAAWRAVAVAMTDKTFPVPKSSGIFAICFSVFGAIMIIIRHYAYRGSWAKYREYHPNMMVIALAFVINSTVYGTAMCIGAIPCYFWAKYYPKSWDIYGYAIAAGFIAGEGIGGVINAIFQVAGISGPDPYGTQIACPGESC